MEKKIHLLLSKIRNGISRETLKMAELREENWKVAIYALLRQDISKKRKKEREPGTIQSPHSSRLLDTRTFMQRMNYGLSSCYMRGKGDMGTDAPPVMSKTC